MENGNEFGLTPKNINLIQSVFQNHPEISEVKVFGSRAMGNYRPESDIDLVLWGNIDINLLGRINRELDELPLPYTFDIKRYDKIIHEPLKKHIDDYADTIYLKR